MHAIVQRRATLLAKKNNCLVTGIKRLYECTSFDDMTANLLLLFFLIQSSFIRYNKIIYIPQSAASLLFSNLSPLCRSYSPFLQIFQIWIKYEL